MKLTKEPKEMFGPNKSKEYISFPFDWIKPGDVQFDASGDTIIKGSKRWMFWTALFRRYLLRKKPIFWMLK